MKKITKKSLITEEFKLTLKFRRWLDVYIQTGNATEAAMQAYDCKDRDSARALGSENLAKLNYVEFLEQSGITDAKLTQKIQEGLDATKPISALVIANTEKGTVQTKDNEGQIEVPDFAVRHKYLETALKLKKRLVGDQTNVQVNNFTWEKK